MDDRTRQSFDALPEIERTVIGARYGLHGEPQTLDEVGAPLGLSREEVRAIENRALKHLEQEWQS